MYTVVFFWVSMKKCNLCFKELSFDNFYKYNKNLYFSRCKKCIKEKYKQTNRKEYWKQYRLKNKEVISLKKKKYHEKNKLKLKEKNKKYRLKNKNKEIERGWKRIGIILTVEQYNEMLFKQNNKCKICNKQDTKKLAVDHCHSTGKVRGLLCFRCNAMLGASNDDINILKQGILYLQEAK